MANYGDVLRAPELPPPVAAAPPTSGYGDALRGDGSELRSTTQKPLPIVDDMSRGADFLTTMRASLAPDDNDKIRRFAAVRFPGMPIDDAVKRYGIIDGEIVYADPGTGQPVKEVATIGSGSGALDTFRRAGQQVASGVGPALPAVAGTVGGVLAIPAGGVLSSGAAGVAAGGTDIARQALDKALAGEPIDIDWWNSLGHGVQNSIAQALGVLGVKAFTRNPLGVGATDRMTAIDPAKRAEWEALHKDASDQGVNLSVGQATGLPSLMQAERQLGSHEATTDRMGAFRQNQRLSEIPAAFENQLNKIGPAPAATDDAIGEFRDAAGNILKDEIKARTKAARPLYRFVDDPTNVVPDPAFAPLAGDEFTMGIIGKIKGNPLYDMKGMPDNSLPVLDAAKKTMDDMIEAAQRAGNSNEAKMLTKKRDALVGVADATFPNEYPAARAVFAGMSPDIDALKKGGIGLLSKMAGMDRVAVARSVFDAGKIDPAEIARMRGMYVKSGKIDDWNQGVRAWLSDKLDDSMKILASGEPGNVPGKLQSSLWGDPRQKRVVEAALGEPALVQGFDRFMDILKAASRSLPENSRTVTDLAAMDPMRSVGMGAKVLAKGASLDTYMNMGNTLLSGWAKIRDPAARVQLADAMLSPDGIKQLKKLRMLSPTSERGLAEATQLLTVAGLTGAENATGLRGTPDRMPEVSIATKK